MPEYTLRIRRYNPETGAAPYWDHYTVDLESHRSVLEGILQVKDRFDASIGGLGGCPYAPGASGNACTEDTVHALQCMGFDTGCDLPALIAAAARLPALVGHDVPGQLVKAGPRDALHAPPPDFAQWRERALARA